jgi:hypothetical protein
MERPRCKEQVQGLGFRIEMERQGGKNLFRVQGSGFRVQD